MRKRPSSQCLFALLLLPAASVAACGGDLVVELQPPLQIEETYPASGAQVPVEALGALRVVFSADLGATAATQDALAEHFRVDASGDGRQWAAVSIAEYSYVAAERVVELSLGPDVRASFGPGWEVRLGVLAGLESAAGNVLARDRYFFFRVGS